MSNERYDLLFDGQMAPATEPEIVKTKLAELFKTDRSGVERLFSGKTLTIKKDLDESSALKYQAVLEQAGAIVTLRPVSERRSAPKAKASESSTQEAKPQTEDQANDGLSIAPAGSTLLKPNEREQVTPVEVDISALSLAEPGPLPSTPVETPPAPDTNYLSVAEAGEDLLVDKPEPQHAKVINTVDFDVAAVGETLAEPKPEEEILLPDISELSLGPEDDQSPLEPPKQQAQETPNTDHLSIINDQD